MLRLSKKADYALMAMKHLALRPGGGCSSAREIAEQYNIPIELMAKVLQRLVRKGLLSSQQGTRGGYQLAREPSVVSVADVIQAIDGPLTVTACSIHKERCGQFAKCNVRDPLWRIRERIISALATCSVSEMAAEAAPQNAARAAAGDANVASADASSAPGTPVATPALQTAPGTPVATAR
jgi:Rrf2 family protein